MPSSYSKTDPMMTQAEFVAWRQTWRDTDRYELRDGEPVAISGGTLGHDAIVANLAAAIGGRLGGGPWRLRRDVLVTSPLDDGFAVFPDLFVDRGDDDGQPDAVADPVAVFEVLSPASQSIDRGSKLDAYMVMPSVRHIGLVYPREVRVELWSRRAEENWPMDQAVFSHLADAMPLAAVDVTVPLAEIYDGTEAARGTD